MTIAPAAPPSGPPAPAARGGDRDGDGGPGGNSEAGPSPESERDQISQNIDAVQDFYSREEQKISRSQRLLEHVSRLIGQPVFLAIILLFVAVWMLANALLRVEGAAQFDPPPFFWLQGIVGLGALFHPIGACHIFIAFGQHGYPQDGTIDCLAGIQD